MQASYPDTRPLSQRLVRVGIGAFLVLTCLRVWLGSEPILPRAAAQLPNPAAQRLDMVREQRRTNVLLDQIYQQLTTGTLHVRLDGADNQSDTPTGSRGADR